MAYVDCTVTAAATEVCLYVPVPCHTGAWHETKNREGDSISQQLLHDSIMKQRAQYFCHERSRQELHQASRGAKGAYLSRGVGRESFAVLVAARKTHEQIGQAANERFDRPARLLEFRNGYAATVGVALALLLSRSESQRLRSISMRWCR